MTNRASEMNHTNQASRSSQNLDVPIASLLKMSLRSIQRNYSSSNEAIDPVLTQGHDMITTSLRSATRVSEVLRAVDLHHANMNKLQIIQALRSIFFLQKSSACSEMAKEDIISCSGFQLLCESLKINMLSLNSYELLDALKTLSYLGVSSNSELMQQMLSVLTKEVNNLSLNQLIFCDFLIATFKVSPVVEALRLALPIVVETHIKFAIDQSNLDILSDALYYAARKELKNTTIDHLVDLIWKKKTHLNVNNCKTVVMSLCEVKNPQKSHIPLLNVSIECLVENISSASYADIDLLVTKLASRFCHIRPQFYQRSYLDATSSFIAQNGCKIEEALCHLRKIFKFGHVSTLLLDYVAAHVQRQPDILTEEPMNIFTLVGALAHADYHPTGWENLEMIIMQSTIPHLTNRSLKWVTFARDMCSLGSWPINLLSKLFSVRTFRELRFIDNTYKSHARLVSLYSSVLSLCDSYNGPYLSQGLVHNIVRKRARTERQYPLKLYICDALKSRDCVLTGVMSRVGHTIDYLAILSDEGCMEPIEELHPKRPVTLLESLYRTGGCHKLAFLHLAPHAYARNTRRFTGQIRMIIQSLENIDIIVIPLSSIVLNGLKEHERSPYILHQIKDRLPNWEAMTRRRI